jgi:hypothetical protein
MIPRKILDGLIESEAKGAAQDIGCTVDEARQMIKQLFDAKRLEVRRCGDGRYILCLKGGKRHGLSNASASTETVAERL